MGPFSGTYFRVTTSIAAGSRQMEPRTKQVPLQLLSQNMRCMNQLGLKITSVERLDGTTPEVIGDAPKAKPAAKKAPAAKAKPVATEVKKVVEAPKAEAPKAEAAAKETKAPARRGRRSRK